MTVVVLRWRLRSEKFDYSRATPSLDGQVEPLELDTLSAEILDQAAEFGIKRICQACSVKYYDLNKSPITCPSCAAEYDPEATLSRRRSRIADEVKPKAEVAAESEEDVVADLPDVELEDDSEFGKPADDSTLLDDDDDDDAPILPEVIIPTDEKEDET